MKAFSWLATLLLALLLPPVARAQQAGTTPELEQYLQLGLANNLVLQQKHIALQKSLLSLQEARSYFLPQVGLGASYQTARGGRTIDLPIGDLLNPVYSTLNQLTGSNAFPQVSNQQEQLFPQNFYDARLRTTYPIVNPDIRYNQRIRTEQVKLSEADIDVYRRELIKDIKTAYYTYLAAEEAVNIYSSTLQLVERGLRTNQSLLNNGKGLPAYVSRSESEVQQVMSQMASSRNEADKAKAYFNFLLNRPLTDSIALSKPTLAAGSTAPALADSNSVAGREELQQLQTLRRINQQQLELQQKFRTPRISTYLDLGSQGFDFAVNSKTAYYLFGLQLDVPIFQGKRNLIRIDQAKKDLDQTQLQLRQTQQQLQLAAFSSRNNTLTALGNNTAAQKQVQAASSYFKLIDRGRAEGTNTFIEWLDARNQLTTAQIQEQITHYRALIAMADYERQTASASLRP